MPHEPRLLLALVRAHSRHRAVGALEDSSWEARAHLSTFHGLADRLALSPAQVKALAPAEKLRRRRKTVDSIAGKPFPHGATAKTPTYLEISPTHFEAISDWHHFAILELATHLAGSSPSRVGSRPGSASPRARSASPSTVS